MTPNRPRVLPLLLATLLAPLGARAFDERSRYALGVEAGMAMPAGPAAFTQDYGDGASVGGRLRQEVTDRWSAGFSFSSQNHKQTLSGAKLNTQPLMAMAFYRFGDAPSWYPYFALGVGFSRNSRQVFAVTQRWTKLSAAAGAGLEFNVGSLQSTAVEVLYRQFTRAGPADENFSTLTASLVFNFYIPDAWVPETRGKKLAAPTPAPEPAAAAPPPDPAARAQAQQELDRVQKDITEEKIQPILFEPGQAVLLSSSYETLDIVGTILKRYPQFGVRVEGHTDDVGADEANLALSQARAESVRAYLVQNFSLPAGKIMALGLGESQPIAANDTEEGKAANRRVEFKIVQ